MQVPRDPYNQVLEAEEGWKSPALQENIEAMHLCPPIPAHAEGTPPDVSHVRPVTCADQQLGFLRSDFG